MKAKKKTKASPASSPSRPIRTIAKVPIPILKKGKLVLLGDGYDPESKVLVVGTPATPESQTSPRNLQKLPTGKKKHQLDKIISPEMGEDEKFQVGFLGALAPYNFLFAALNKYFRRELELKNHPQGEGTQGEVEAAIRELAELMFSAVQSRDASFFKALSDLLPLADVGRDCYGVSPVVVWLVHFLRFREDGAFLELFPEWPPTISELQKALREVGVEADHTTIREKVKLLGFPVRPKGPGRN